MVKIKTPLEQAQQHRFRENVWMSAVIALVLSFVLYGSIITYYMPGYLLSSFAGSYSRQTTCKAEYQRSQDTYAERTKNDHCMDSPDPSAPPTGYCRDLLSKLNEEVNKAADELRACEMNSYNSNPFLSFSLHIPLLINFLFYWLLSFGALQNFRSEQGSTSNKK